MALNRYYLIIIKRFSYCNHNRKTFVALNILVYTDINYKVISEGIVMKKNKELILSGLIVILIYGLLFIIGITCPIKYITGISCAGCGMSRAYFSLLHFDFKSAFYYHPLFMIPPIFFLIYIFKSKINLKFYKFFMLTIILLFVIVYLYRMLNGSDGIVVFQPKNGLLFRWGNYFLHK